MIRQPFASFSDFPMVSLLVAMRNEERYITDCLLSLFTQDYPADRLEILVMDGNSNDSSRQLVKRLFQGRQNCLLIANPKITQSAGWNLGIQICKGDIIGIVSAHSVLASDYVFNAVETLKRTGADLVGGPMRASGHGWIANAISYATSTPFGVGGARFHYTDKEEIVDTVYMGLCRKDVYHQIGGFDEEMVRNQDDELSYRLLKHGGQILCNPGIRSIYYNRSTLKTLWRQYYQYGFWKVRVLQKHPYQMRLRHFVPPMFVAAIACSAILSLFVKAGLTLLICIYLAYLIANLASSILTAYRYGWKYLPLLPLIYAILHFSYGLGFLVGLMKFASRWPLRSPAILRLF